MHIKKLAHCCLVIDLKASDGKERRILIDPGSFSVDKHDKLNHADIILITHEHADHFHIESLKSLVKRAPDASVVTNDAVGEILAKEGIEHKVMHQGDSVEIKGVRIEAYGKEHALIHSSIPRISNVGFFIQGRFFFPGDALTDPKREIDVLALPVAGPWIKISEAIDYALKLKPRTAFPVHDAVRTAAQHVITEKILSANGIDFIRLEEDGSLDVA